MKLNTNSKMRLGLLLIIILNTNTILLSADLEKGKLKEIRKSLLTLDDPIVEDDWKWHKIGTLWNRVTNFSYMGDDAYNNRTPSCDWPGTSGNSYLYRGTLWLSAFVDGTFHTTKGDDHEFAPLDSVHVFTGTGTRSEQDTYTRYYDVKAPLASGHFPLGLEVVERTYAWSVSYAADFIIYEYTIKNVGIDSDGDGYPDTPRTLDDFYFTIRFDADVSKLVDWGAEYRFSNEDDHAIANGVSWDWIELFPDMAGRDHGLTEEDIDSTLMIMFDGDNPSWPADNGEDNDFGNPGVDNTLQTPGFIGIKVLKTEPYLKPHSFHVCHIYNDPDSDQETWDRMISIPTFEEILLNPYGDPHPLDYRGILTFGPLETFATGDSIVVTTALGVGCDPDSGGVYSLVELVKIMDVAQFIVDYDYAVSAEALAPPAPTVDVEQLVIEGVTKGIIVSWDDLAITHPNFQSFLAWKGIKGSTGAIDWSPLGLGSYADTLGSTSWPPPPADEAGYYQLIDSNVVNGFVYYYSVQAATGNIAEPIPFGIISSNIQDQKSFKVISPSNPVANTLDNIKVVPNPYLGSVPWNNRRPGDSSPWEHSIQFTNLPADAKIKIFTLDGDYIDEIEVNRTVVVGGDFDTSSPSVAEWDLMTRNDQEAAPGIYLYVVDSKLGQKVGKFIIVR